MTPERTRRRNARGEGGRLATEIVDGATRLTDAGAELTLRAIAREAGIAGPSIYDHFADVGAIREEMMRACYADLVARIAEAQTGTEDPVLRLGATCAAYLDYGEEYPHRYALLFRGERDRDEKVAVGPSGAAALDTLVEGIAACVAAGRSASTDPADDAVALWLGLHGLATMRQSRPLFVRLREESFVANLIQRLGRLTDPT